MKKSVLTLFIAVSALGVSGQHNPSLYPVPDIMQNQFANPAFLPYSNVSIGLPAISHMGMRVGFSGFPIGQIVSFSGNQETVDVADLVKKLDKKNTLSGEMSVALLSIGLRKGSMYFHASVRERATAQFILPKDMATLVFEGNGAFTDRPADLSDLGFHTSIFREYALGASFPVGDKLRLGVRGKFLSGAANFTTEESRLALTTDGETNYAIAIDGKYRFQTSNMTTDPDEFLQNGYLSFGNLGEQNPGYAIDLGATYELNDRIALTAALIDLGAIKWNNNVEIYESNDFHFEYSGVDMFDLFEDQNPDEAEQEFLDSLDNAIDLTSRSGSYSSRLTTRFVASGELTLSNQNKVGLILAGEFVPKSLQPYATGYYRFQWGKKLNLVLSNSFAYGSILNPGFGFSAKLGPAQLFLASDNFLGIILPENTRGSQFTFGLNLAFGGTAPVKDVVAPEAGP